MSNNVEEAAPGHRLGVDVGGTKIAAGLVDGTGRIVARQRLASSVDESAEALTERLLDLLQTLCDTSKLPIQEVSGAALGFPGDFDGASGALRTCPNLPLLVGSRPAALFAAACRRRWHLDLPVAADNDTVVAVLGEAHFGAGRGVRRLLYVTVSTGVGGARYDGQRCVNLEPGLRLFPSPESPDRCLEELAGGAHLARRARRQLRRWAQSLGQDGLGRRTSVLRHPELLSGSLEERLGRLTARHLGAAAAAGDAWSRGLFWAAAEHVAAALSLLLDEGWGEQRIVVGGAIAQRVDGFLPRVRQGLRRRQASPEATESRRRFPAEELVAAGLGEERGILGAVLLLSGGGSLVT